MEIVNESIANKDERICLHFSPDAGQKWIAFYNEVETEMQLIGFLSDFKDYASKVAENMARIAALLHYFNGDEGDISLTAVDAAIEISSWYVNEYIKLFSKPQEVNMVNTDAVELYWWIKEYCNRNFIPYMRKNTILQNGPDRFRKCSKANELLSILYSQGKINAYKKGKTLFIQPTSTLDVI